MLQYAVAYGSLLFTTILQMHLTMTGQQASLFACVVVTRILALAFGYQTNFFSSTALQKVIQDRSKYV